MGKNLSPPTCRPPLGGTSSVPTHSTLRTFGCACSATTSGSAGSSHLPAARRRGARPHPGVWEWLVYRGTAAGGVCLGGQTRNRQGLPGAEGGSVRRRRLRTDAEGAPALGVHRGGDP